ncbi:MAG TPA: vWA domain-containing protein [Polyangiaceae bacterium]|nr:vWA domain-containing protein [Polyangiaceae bacterium]
MNRAALLFSATAFVSASVVSACSPSSSPPDNSGPVSGAGGSPFGSGGATGAGGTGIFGTGGDTVFNAGGSGTGAGGNSCGATNYQSTLIPSSILFVVDRSGSMNCNLTTSSADCEAHPVTADTSKPTRWSSIVTGIGAALDQLATVPNTSVGLTFFSNDDVCGVTSAPNVDLADLTQPQVDALKNALANGNPKGGTPIVGATILAYKHLHQQAMAPGNRFVVLVTDGEDSCIPSTQDGGSGHTTYADQGITGDVVSRLLGTEMPKAATVNIRTFVIGAPGSEPGRGLLSAIAFAGNTARDPNCEHDPNVLPAAGAECHLDMTRSSDFGTDLAAALKKITGQAISCEFDVPLAADGKRVDTNKLNVDYYKNGGTTEADIVNFYKDDACTSPADGWYYTDVDKTKIQLCGGACDAIRADAKAKVQVALSCQGQRAR